MMNLLEAFLDMVYPPRCVVCDKIIYFPGYCDSCVDKIKPITGERCFVCGQGVKDCDCKYFVYHFDGIVAPYYNEGFAQDAIYGLKFHDKFSCLEPFSKEMADLALKTFGRENIDLICFVPANKHSLNTRGFNQCELLAKRISKRTGIPINKRVLKKKNNVKTQHELNTVEKRFRNVRGAYYTSENVNNKNILLVDDIKTSGASLDGCARQLKFSGASHVYCVTALISSYKKK